MDRPSILCPNTFICIVLAPRAGNPCPTATSTSGSRVTPPTSLTAAPETIANETRISPPTRANCRLQTEFPT